MLERCRKIKLVLEKFDNWKKDIISNNVKDKVTDSNKETYHSETPEPSSTRNKRKCILTAKYRSN